MERDVASSREQVLDAAKAAVMVDRNADYGAPENNFQDIAALWHVYTGQEFSTVDVAVMMILVKVSRMKTSPGKVDHAVDIAGYAACAGGIVLDHPDWF